MQKKITRRDFAFLLFGAASLSLVNTANISFKNYLKSKPVPITRDKDSKLIVFVHNPKTGGTSLRDHVKKNLISSKLEMPDSHLTYNRAMNNIEHVINNKDVLYLRGHFSMDNSLILDNYKEYTDLITVLRKPTGRVPSSYRYQIKHWATSGSYLEGLKNKNITNYAELIDIILKEKDNPNQFHFELNDGLVRRLSGVGTKVGFGEVNDEIFNKAKANLKERFILIGILEEYNKFLFMLSKKYNWEIDVKIHKNKTKRSPLSQEEEQAILSINQYDAKLYEYAKKLSHDMFNSFGPNLDEQYQAFIQSKC